MWSAKYQENSMQTINGKYVYAYIWWYDPPIVTTRYTPYTQMYNVNRKQILICAICKCHLQIRMECLHSHLPSEVVYMQFVHLSCIQMSPVLSRARNRHTYTTIYSANWIILYANFDIFNCRRAETFIAFTFLMNVLIAWCGVHQNRYHIKHAIHHSNAAYCILCKYGILFVQSATTRFSDVHFHVTIIVLWQILRYILLFLAFCAYNSNIGIRWMDDSFRL